MHSLTTVGVIWSMFSFIVAIVCSTGFYMPYWLQGDIMNVTVHLGVFRRCNFLARDLISNAYYVREECGRYKRFNDIPSNAWKAGTIMFGIACGILVLISFISVLAFCFDDIITKRSAKVCGFFQGLAGKWILTLYTDIRC